MSRFDLPPIDHYPVTPPLIEFENRFFFRIASPVAIDEFWGCIYDPTRGIPEGIISDFRGNYEDFLLLDVPPGNYAFQIFGYRGDAIVAGCFGSAHELVDGQVLTLIPATLQ